MKSCRKSRMGECSSIMQTPFSVFLLFITGNYDSYKVIKSRIERHDASFNENKYVFKDGFYTRREREWRKILHLIRLAY